MVVGVLSVAEVPQRYPHGSPDDEIRATMQGLAQEMLMDHNINSVLTFAPLISVGQSELQARIAERSAEQLAGAVGKLHKSIEIFRTASDRAAERLESLTRKLVVLTVVLLIATMALVAATIAQLVH